MPSSFRCVVVNTGSWEGSGETTVIIIITITAAAVLVGYQSEALGKSLAFFAIDGDVVGYSDRR